MPGWSPRSALASMLVWNRRSALLAAIGAGVLMAGIASGAVIPRLVTSRPPSPVAQHTPTSSPTPVVKATPDSWWKPLPTASGPFVPASIVIEKFHLRAPIEQKGVDSHNTMESPDQPTDVAWYTFTAKPGSGSNAVFAGQKDNGNAGNPAVFSNLDQLVAGDLIDVVSDHQTEIRYQVTQTWNYALNAMPMADVLATDPTEEVTLITSAGTFTRGGYDHRFVVRAVRTTV